MKGDLEEPIVCLRCRRATNNLEDCQLTTFETDNYPDVIVCLCPFCNKPIGLCSQNKYKSLEFFLRNNEKCTDGWAKVENDSDRQVLFVLNQIIYNLIETPDEDQFESEYGFQSPKDLSKLLWINRQAVGFYSAKYKGSLDMETFETYSMATMDTIFIRKSHRRQGFATNALQNLLTEFPNQNIGFSYPISNSMKKVLFKHLERCPQDRKSFWEITGCGGPSNCRNLWILLFKKNRDKILNSENSSTFHNNKIET